MDASVFLRISLVLLAIVFTFGDSTGKLTESTNITGFLAEPLDLVCIESREDKELIVMRLLRKFGKLDPHEPFVSSRWNASILNFTKICNQDHKLDELCFSQVTSHVSKNNETHFVIKSVPRFLHGYYTQCFGEYKSLKDSTKGNKQLIKLRDKIKGYVDGRIEIECRIPNETSFCNANLMTTIVYLKIRNMKNDENVVQKVKISQAESGKPACVHPNESKYYDICSDQMNTTYVNGSRVIFVFERIPDFLNNSIVYWGVKFLNCLKADNYQDPIKKIIFLQYNNGTTPTTAPNTTTSSDEIKATQTAKVDEKPTWDKRLLYILLILIPLIIIIFAVYYKCKNSDIDDNVEEMEMEAL